MTALAGLAVALLSLALTAAGAAAGEHRELRVGVAGERFCIEADVVRPGLVRAVRAPRWEVEWWVVEALDARGAIRFCTALPDPLRGRADHLTGDRNEPELLAGEEILLDGTLLAVQVPAEAGLARLRVRTGARRAVIAELPLAAAPLAALPSARGPGTVAGPVYESYTLRRGGDPANRVDLVILGDGYRAEEIASAYRAKVEAVTAHLLDDEEPLRRYRGYVNVHVVDVVSNESGTDDPRLGVVRDTALDTTLSLGGTRCSYTTSPRKVLDAAAQAPAPADVILIAINDPTYGGCGLQFAVASGSNPDTHVHELGHAFGKLADEYGGFGTYTGAPVRRPNATTERLRENIPWRRWIAPGTLLPTFDTTAIGLFEGANLWDVGQYRPTATSKMRALGETWRPVNSEALVKRLYDLVDPIDAHARSESLVDLRGAAQRRVAITPVSPQLDSLRREWRLDGLVVGHADAVDISAAQVPLGSQRELTVTLFDDTTLVRDRDSGAPLHSTRAWTIVNGVAPMSRSPSPSPTPTGSPTPCACDCAGDGAVTVDELTRSVRIALGDLAASACAAADGDGRVAVAELVRGVAAALGGCADG